MPRLYLHRIVITTICCLISWKLMIGLWQHFFLLQTTHIFNSMKTKKGNMLIGCYSPSDLIFLHSPVVAPSTYATLYYTGGMCSVPKYLPNYLFEIYYLWKIISLVNKLIKDKALKTLYLIAEQTKLNYIN